MRIKSRSRQRRSEASQMTWEWFFQSPQGQAILRIVTTVLTVALEHILK